MAGNHQGFFLLRSLGTRSGGVFTGNPTRSFARSPFGKTGSDRKFFVWGFRKGGELRESHSGPCGKPREPCADLAADDIQLYLVSLRSPPSLLVALTGRHKEKNHHFGGSNQSNPTLPPTNMEVQQFAIPRGKSSFYRGLCMLTGGSLKETSHQETLPLILSSSKRLARPPSSGASDTAGGSGALLALPFLLGEGRWGNQKQTKSKPS